MNIDNFDDLTRGLIDLIVTVVVLVVVIISCRNLCLIIALLPNHCLKVLVGLVCVNKFVLVHFLADQWSSLAIYRKAKLRLSSHMHAPGSQ